MRSYKVRTKNKRYACEVAQKQQFFGKKYFYWNEEIMKSNNISENTRPAKAGKQLAKALLEIINLLYLDKNILCFLNSFLKNFTKPLEVELERRKIEWDEKKDKPPEWKKQYLKERKE